MKTGLMPRTLTTVEIRSFLDSLLGRYRVLAPVSRNGLSRFDWIETASEIEFFSGGIPLVPPKEALLPRTEVLFYFKADARNESLAPPPPPSPQIIFGLHPCDLRAVRVLDTVFGAPPHPDGPYLARRQVTTLIGMGSLPGERPAGSFFENLGISSMDTSDCDIFLAPLADGRYVLETLTGKGVELVGYLSAGNKTTRSEEQEVQRLRSEAQSWTNRRFAAPEFRTSLEQLFEAPLWDKLADTCLACGTCAFLCPTCHCFDIQDEVRRNKGCRIRLWDTCQFDPFTLHASGHNPRPEQKQRARQRVFHKFVYGPKNYQIPFCVGCGRCTMACPMHQDLLHVLEEIEETRNRRENK